MKKYSLPDDLKTEIEWILSRGNRAEVLIERGQITVVEIQRRLKAKGGDAHEDDPRL